MIKAYTNARLIDPATGLDTTGALLTNGDTIQSFGPTVAVPAGADVTDCKGRILCPGLIDMRAHAVDADAALAGGITTIILQPDQTTKIDSDPVVERILRRSEEGGSVRVYPMGAATRGMKGTELAEIGQMAESGAVAFTDCRRAVANSQVMRRLLEYAGYFNTLVVQFAEEASLAAGGIAHEGEIATRLGLTGIPSVAEVIQIERDVRLSELTGTPVHFAIVSSREGVAAIRRAKAAGVRVTCSTAPHYLHLNDNALEGYRTFARVSPPLRSEEDRLALIEGLADGTIDTLVSDHDPRSEDVKRLPVSQAAIGVVGFETLLALGLSQVNGGKVPLMRLLTTLTSAPANLLGLPQGRFTEGAPADLVIFDPDKPWRIERETQKARARNTPFDTLPVQGKVWRTIVGGKTLFTGD